MRKDNLYKHLRKFHGEDTAKIIRNAKVERQANKETAKAEKQDTATSFNFTRDVQKGHFLCPRCHCPFLTKLKRDDHAKCHKKLKKYMCRHKTSENICKPKQ